MGFVYQKRSVGHHFLEEAHHQLDELVDLRIAQRLSRAPTCCRRWSNFFIYFFLAIRFRFAYNFRHSLLCLINYENQPSINTKSDGNELYRSRQAFQLRRKRLWHFFLSMVLEFYQVFVDCSNCNSVMGSFTGFYSVQIQL